MSLLLQELTHTYFDPQFSNLEEALGHSTFLGVGAHPDDLEVMAHHGILAAKGSKNYHFSGVICTSGSGSVTGDSLKGSNEAGLAQVRAQEQINAAKLGQFGSCLLLAYESCEIKERLNHQFVSDLQDLLEITKPKVIYTHNIFDKHKTHVSVVVHLIAALKNLSYCPEAFYGCEVWRGLDWIADEDKKILSPSDVNHVKELITCHKSQLEEKDYAEATVARMKSNATFFDASKSDQFEHQLFAMDLLPLLGDVSLKSWVEDHLLKFKKSVDENLKGFV